MTMAVFQDAAREYAAAGIAALPLGGLDGKKPLVSHPQKFGVRASLQIAEKFPEANAGFWCGPRSRLTVVDIDSPKDSELQWAIDTFGPSPIVIRTGSQKHHVWYKHDGEGRRIDAIDGHKIDLLGQGLCVAPPSIRPGGSKYEFVQGSLADVGNLPTINRDALRALRPPKDKSAVADTVDSIAGEGSRNTSLFDFARSIGQGTTSFDALLNALCKTNAETNNPPLPDVEVQRTARKVWQYREEGRLMTPGGAQYVGMSAAKIEPMWASGNSDALMLELRLRKAHEGQRDHFAASPKAMAEARLLGSWSARRYQNALNDLCGMQRLERIARGGRGAGDPALYRLK
jgi:hypothetical protein